MNAVPKESTKNATQLQKETGRKIEVWWQGGEEGTVRSAKELIEIKDK